MSHCLSNRIRRASLLACAVVASGAVTSLQAGPPERPRPPKLVAQPKALPTPKMVVSKEPYLKLVGPALIVIKPIPGPSVRIPPLLPRPEPAEPTPKSIDPAAPVPGPTEPSVLSQDAPITLLPAQKAPSAPVPERKVEAGESVLAPEARAEMELKDSVLFFEKQVGPYGSRVSVPVPIAPTLPAEPPASRATYRKEKE